MNTSYQHKIPDNEREAFEQALTIYYSGKGRIRDAFARVERGLLDRYYRRRKEYPNEIQAIMRKARADVKSVAGIGVAAEQQTLDDLTDIGALVGGHLAFQAQVAPATCTTLRSSAGGC